MTSFATRPGIGRAVGHLMDDPRLRAEFDSNDGTIIDLTIQGERIAQIVVAKGYSENNCQQMMREAA